MTLRSTVFQTIMLLDFAFLTNSFTLKDLFIGVTWKLAISTDMQRAVTKISRYFGIGNQLWSSFGTLLPLVRTLLVLTFAGFYFRDFNMQIWTKDLKFRNLSVLNLILF